jgi:MFS transporter, DHA2 family, multidrug resistance protein
MPGSPRFRILVIVSSPPSGVEYGLRRIVIVSGIMIAALLQAVDGTIVNVALPTIQGNLGASSDEATWVITAYLIANVIMIPLTPWLSDRLGRKTYFLLSIFGFTTASLLCASAPSIDMLILYRFVQGAFGAGCFVVSNTILTDTFAPEEFGLAQSLFTLGVSVGGPLGLILGGALTDNLSWRWVFNINLPLGLISGLVLLAFLRNTEGPKKLPIDTAGIVLLALGIAGVEFFFAEGERWYWLADPNIRVAAMLGALGLTAFALWELYGTKRPIFDLRVLRFRALFVGLPLAFALAIAYFTPMLFLPQYAQDVLGFTPTDSGMLLAIRAVPAAFAVPLAGSLVASGRIDVRVMLAVGFALMGISGIVEGLQMTPLTGFWTMSWALVLNGVANGMVFSPVYIAILCAVPPTEIPKANAAINIMFQFGGTIAAAMVVTGLDRREAFHYAVLGDAMTLHAPAVARAATSMDPGTLYGIITAQAAALSFADLSIGVGVVSLIAAPIALILGRRNPDAEGIHVAAI